MTLSLAMVSVFGFTTFAQNPNTCTDPECVTAQCNQPNGPKDKRYRPTCIEEIAFEGILLTPEQQNAVNQVKANRKAQREQARAKQAAADSTRKAECLAARQQAKREYLKQIQSILTPEQYITFLENIAVAQPQNGKAPKGGPKAFKGQKGDRAPQGKMSPKGKKTDNK